MRLTSKSAPVTVLYLTIRICIITKCCKSIYTFTLFQFTSASLTHCSQVCSSLAAPWSSRQPEADGAAGFFLQQHSTTIVREATNKTAPTAIRITTVLDKPQLWQVPSLQHKPAQPSSFSHFTPSQLSLQYIVSNVPQQCLVHSLMRPYLFPTEQSKHIVYKRWLVRISKQERGVLANIVMPRSMFNVALLVLLACNISCILVGQKSYLRGLFCC